MNQKKILIVEDDQDMRQGLQIRLRSLGYSIAIAADAIAAVAAAQRERPDLVLLDLGLPGGDGFLVMERLRALLLLATPVIVLTGRSPDGNLERARQLGATVFLQKPVDNDVLANAVRLSLKGWSGLNPKAA